MIGFLRKGRPPIEEDAINSGIKTSSSPWPIADKMARILYIRNPSQPDDCLSGAMAAVHPSHPAAVRHVHRGGDVPCRGRSSRRMTAKSGDDHRCFPAAGADLAGDV